jgi:hypothetical protein
MRVKEPIFTMGSQVLIKLKRNRKSDSEWDLKRPYVVTAVKGSMVTASRDDHYYSRATQACFKLYRIATSTAVSTESSTATLTTLALKSTPSKGYSGGIY